MLTVDPVTLEGHGVRIEPLSTDHADGVRAAVADGELWRIRVTSAPHPDQIAAYIADAMNQAGRVPFVITDTTTDRIVGCSSYYDIDLALGRLGIGYTWYAASAQRTHVNTATKLALMTHAFETLAAAVIVWHTDNFNFASQRAIERLGAKLDGVLRYDKIRRDGTVRDTYQYSMLTSEWAEAKAQLEYLVQPRAS